MERSAECDPNATGRRHSPRVMQHTIESLKPDGHDRHVEPRRYHADTRTKAIDLAGVGTLAFRKNQDGKAILDDVADVPQRLARAGFALRKRKSVKEQSRKIVVERAGEPRQPACTRRGRSGP